VRRREPDHLAVVVVPEHLLGRLGIELLGVRVERHHVIALLYLVV